MACNYVVTAHKPTAANASLFGNFTGPHDLNLIVAKNNRLDIQLVTAEGLVPLLDVGVYGRIASMQLIRPENENCDLLFVLTCRYRVCILQYKPETKSIITRAYGDMKNRVSRPSETGLIGIVDPDCKVICLKLYDGWLKLIPLELDTDKEMSAEDVRLEELQVLDVKFLYGFTEPTIALIYESGQNRYLKTYEISLQNADIHRQPWNIGKVEEEAFMILPVPPPSCGMVVIGAGSISYYKGQDSLHITPASLKDRITCFGRVDSNGCRYLLGDYSGRLFMLILVQEHSQSGIKVKDLCLEYLGETSIPSCITYLDNAFAYIGSSCGDSQLIKLNTSPDSETDSYIDVIDNFTNLGPIIDMVSVDLDKQGQSQLVTCSGFGKNASLRVLRNGIGIHELANIDLDHICGIWRLRTVSRSISEYDDVLVLSFAGHSRFLKFDGREVEETDISGFDDYKETDFAANVAFDQIVQISNESVRLAGCDGRGLLQEWKPPNGKTISKSTAGNTQIMVASGCELFYLEIGEGELKQVSNISLEHDIACIDISLKDDNERAQICAVGLWVDMSARLLLLPNLQLMLTESLGGDIIPRSIMLNRFDNEIYLLVAMGDGTLAYYLVNTTTCSLTNRKSVNLGVVHSNLYTFKSGSISNVFACSDRPTVIYINNHKLVFSNVNLKKVNFMSPFHSESFPNSLALVNDSGFIIGTIDEIQKLHIRTKPLGETTRQEESQSFGIITCRTEVPSEDDKNFVPTHQSASLLVSNRTMCPEQSDNSSSTFDSDTLSEKNIDSVLIIDQHSLDAQCALQLQDCEWGMSLISCMFENDPEAYYCVGTAFVNLEDKEPTKGNIRILKYFEGKIQQVHSKEVSGAVYCMVAFNGKLLASVNSTVSVYEWTSNKELVEETSFHNNVLALYLKTKGDFILIGDLMRSISLCAYRPMNNEIELICKNNDPNWMTAVEIIDDDSYLGGENSHNLFTCQKNSSSSEEEQKHLPTVGVYHVGEFVNVFRQGSLVMQNTVDIPDSVQGSILFGTVSGAVGVVVTLAPAMFEFVSAIANKLSTVVKGVGKIEHQFWRSFSNDRKTEPCQSFVDGDLVESFLDLSPEDMQRVANGLTIQTADGTRPAMVEDVLKTVEELSRIH
ncbi:DNA damage-binding protein 1 [Trichoplax sp. H2]|nr:DNA damage-binding protein 1 [Trichoplax sp. H2]|eukprot:RDD41784.1 DNA damage-binding protein 1 [Trichoplax sp. H2]